jgi:hypothetical protein
MVRNGNRQIPEKVFFILSTGLLFILFFVSTLIHFHDRNTTAKDLDGKQLIEYASLYLQGQPRERSGKLLDCSGFTRTVYRKFSVRIPFTSYEQYKKCKPITSEDLQPGDLVFFNTSGNGISHVGLYFDNERFIHSPGYNRRVRIDSLTHSYFKNRFISGGRVIFEAD